MTSMQETIEGKDTMETRASVALSVVICLALILIGGCSVGGAMPREETVKQYDAAGLELEDLRGVDLAWFRPTTDFSRYDSVIVEPVTVAFLEDWDVKRPGSAFSVTDKEIERMQSDLASTVYDKFVHEIQQGKKYPLVTEPAKGVLRIKLALVDMRLNAPDFQYPGRLEQYARSAGEWTLVAELVDAETGELVGRLMDHWVDPDEERVKRFTRIDNDLALSRAIHVWAEAVRRKLEVSQIRMRMEGAGEGLRPTGQQEDKP